MFLSKTDTEQKINIRLNRVYIWNKYSSYQMSRSICIIIPLVLLSIQAFAQEVALQKIDSKHFKRLHKLNDSLFRSEQPGKKGFAELEAMGVKTIINFRRKVDDAKRAKGTTLQLERLPLKAAELNESHIIDALRLIQTSEKPVLIHCWHGSDRTGAIAAAYRIVVEDWSREDAIAEMRLKELSHHEKRYPNVIELLKELNVEDIKAAVNK